MRSRWLLTMVTFFFSISVEAHISNMIVFGDSLSDGGNFPESDVAFLNEKAPETLLNSVAQFYVPFSNPVDTKQANPESFPWPTLNDHYLSKQAAIKNHPSKRKYRSISWPQFFLSLAKYKKVITSDLISPSDLLNSRNLPPTISYNYAWGYATSGTHCVNPHYVKINSCDAKSIMRAKKNYDENPSAANYKKIQIPGVMQQVALFIHDQHLKKIKVDQETLYTFWVGGNDLIAASNALNNDKNPFPAIAFALGNTGTHILKSVGALLHALPKNKRPAKVYVFELFNPGLTPAYYGKKIASFGNQMVKYANFWLRWDARLFNIFSKTKIIIVPTYQWYQFHSHDSYFKNRLGEDCLTVTGNYENPVKVPLSNCDGFIFWNAVHPTSEMNAIVAQSFFNDIYPKRITLTQ